MSGIPEPFKKGGSFSTKQPGCAYFSWSPRFLRMTAVSRIAMPFLTVERR